MSTRRVQFALNVNPTTSPDIAAQVPAALKAIIEKQQQVRFERAHLKTLDQEFIGYEIVYYVLDPNYTLFMDIQQAIILDTMQLLDQLSISTAKRAQPVKVIAAEVQSIAPQAAPQAEAAPAPRPSLIKSAS
jgi:hypothetical protein